MASFSRYLSACLGFVERDAGRQDTLEMKDFDLKLDKRLVECALCRHFDDPSIKVTKLLIGSIF